MGVRPAVGNRFDILVAISTQIFMHQQTLENNKVRTLKTATRLSQRAETPREDRAHHASWRPRGGRASPRVAGPGEASPHCGQGAGSQC